MSYNVEVTSFFKGQAKRLFKKSPSLKEEIAELIEKLEIEPAQGVSIGNHCYKVRLSIGSKGNGKSGGARVITHIQAIENSVYLLSIYDKSEQSDVSDNEINSLIKLIP